MNKRIYKLDSKGKVRFLEIITEGGNLIQNSGVLGSENIVNHVRTCSGKNVGKSNETSPSEQAIFEAKSKLKAKLEEGYYENIEDCKTQVLVLPMLAKSFEDHESKVTFPAYAQPKLDGMRSLKDNADMISRKNKKIENMDHIANECSGESVIFDGELYAHGLSFQENMKLIKKYRKGESEKVKYHVYDIVEPNLSFSERYQALKDILKLYKPENIELVPTYKINNKEELRKYHSQFIGEGYEGTIVRWGEAGYKVDKRSENLLKYKDFIDITAEVIDVIPSEKRPTHGKLVCKMNEKKWIHKSSTGVVIKLYDEEVEITSGTLEYDYPTFGCGLRFTFEERENILTNKQEFIGETAEIRFFEYTDSNIPRFPVCVGFRLDK